MSKTIRGIIYQYEDGGTYCGEWEKDSAEGYGCGTGPKGQGRFEGCWKNGSQVSGVYTWPQGMKYMGEWKENQRNGLGREIREEGSEYCGEFTRGARGTYGVIKLPNGTYRGSWRNGKQDGEGEEAYVDGGCYRGQYKNGVRSGFGTRASAAYELNEKDSNNRIKSQDPNKKPLPAPPTNSKKISIISMSSADSANSSSADVSSKGSSPELMAQIYEGEWKNDKRHGHGVIKCIGSYTYYGQWDNNSRTGYGVLMYENGLKEEGQWHGGQLIAALKRRKINFKSHQLEAKVQSAYTQAIQAADAARNKALLAESRATSATSKFKMAKVVAVRAEKDALLAREKAELYKNAPRISENMKSPIQDPTMSPTHFFQTREPSGEGNNYMKYLGLDSSANGATGTSMSHSPSFETIQGLPLSRPISAPVMDSGSDSDPDTNSEYRIVRQSSGRSSASSARSSLDYSSLRRHNRANFYLMESTGTGDNLFDRRRSEGSGGRERERAVKANKGDPGVLEEVDYEEYDTDDSEENFSSKLGGRREGTMARKRKRDKTTGELEQSSDEETSEERAARAKIRAGDAKSENSHPIEANHSVAMEMLVHNLNQMANWNKMIAYVNFFLLIFLMILILVVIGSMYYYQLVSYYHNHQETEAQGPTSFISPIA